MQTMVQCIDRSAKHDFYRNGIMFVFYLGLPHVCIHLHVHVHVCMCDYSMLHVYISLLGSVLIYMYVIGIRHCYRIRHCYIIYNQASRFMRGSVTVLYHTCFESPVVSTFEQSKNIVFIHTCLYMYMYMYMYKHVKQEVLSSIPGGCPGCFFLFQLAY